MCFAVEETHSKTSRTRVGEFNEEHSEKSSAKKTSDEVVEVPTVKTRPGRRAAISGISCFSY